jgi:SPP1 family phage portal protein
MFRISKDTELTEELLQEFLDEHAEEVKNRYLPLFNAYMSDHDILRAPAKAKWKPDNRIVVNFPKYIVDTTNGFFIGNPIKTVADDKAVSDFVEYIDQYNDQDDNNAELSKLCCIFGKGYEMYFTDEDAQLCITYLSPIDAFMIFDDSILERPLYFVRRYTDRDGNEWGSVANGFGVRYFKVSGGVKWRDEGKTGKDIKDGWKAHYFPGVPATEYVENTEKQGAFEPVLTMVNAYNKALSEKANDVDYFADAYLKVLGAKVESEDVEFIRDNRILNFEGEDAQKIIAEFMAKPSNDEGQEHLLDRLERLIFCIGQTANASDENFGTQSGIAMLYKMWNTSNKGKTKQRKFESGMNRRYRLLFGHPSSKVTADAWCQLHYQFTPNIPQNLLEEAEIAGKLEGVTSHETQLKVLSIVDNVEDELDKIEEENKADETIIDKMMFPNAPGNAEGVNNEQSSVLE